MIKRLHFILISALMSLSFTHLKAQSLNNATIEGTITDASGKPLAGVTIVAIHKPSGTQYGATTRDDGHFNLAGVRIGGPYKIVATSVGYTEQHSDSIF